MIEIADVFRRFAGDYLSAHGASMPPSHRRAIADILACRTEALGGRIWRCDNCSAEIFSYHSCKNRSCPKCHGPQTERWLETRKAEMLPCPYFHVTVTVPEELRDALRANQRDGYALLMKAAADAIVELARDPRYVGATVGVLAVLHTWTQQLTIRRQTVEHPFGTLKAWMGSAHFLSRTLEKVKTEMSLQVLAYNIKRMLNIFGIKPLMEAIAA